MEELIIELLKDPSRLMSGIPLNWENVPPDKKVWVMTAALHCVLNGPVGVAKVTNFPTLEAPTKIKDLVPVSNKSWKGFCFAVALVVKKIQPGLKSSSVDRNGDFWPLVDWK